jgi:hypothetical protein
MKFSWKVTYPDGDVEFWYNTVTETISELSRLQKIHNNKVRIEPYEGHRLDL